jgi:hypothetical protein
MAMTAIGAMRYYLTEAAALGEEMDKAGVLERRFERMRYLPDARWEYLILPNYAADQDVGGSLTFEETDRSLLRGHRGVSRLSPQDARRRPEVFNRLPGQVRRCASTVAEPIGCRSRGL